MSRAAPSLPAVAARASITGTVASLTTTGLLALVARLRGLPVHAPTSATSHWLHGDAEAVPDVPDLAHTGVGYATHHASAVFWALPFEFLLEARPPRRVADIAVAAAGTAAVAAVVDYGLVPRRLSPGWENVMPPRDIALAFGALAVGLAAGAVAARALIGRDDGTGG